MISKLRLVRCYIMRLPGSCICSKNKATDNEEVEEEEEEEEEDDKKEGVYFCRGSF